MLCSNLIPFEVELEHMVSGIMYTLACPLLWLANVQGILIMFTGVSIFSGGVMGLFLREKRS